MRRGGDSRSTVAVQSPLQPAVVALNCLDDPSVERDALFGIASVDHVSLGHLSDGRIETAAAVLLHSLAFLPRAAQRRLHSGQLILCLGSADQAVDSALAADLGLRLVHVDADRTEEIADTVMALFLGLLRRTHLLARHAASATSASAGWLGSLQPLCRGMRRCRGLVLGIIGQSASARCLATRSLAFKMNVLYFDFHVEKGKSRRPSVIFPPAARRMDTLNDLLAASDLISLHCSLSDETVHLLNAECLQHIKPGAFIVNTGSSQLIDDCSLKQLLLDGTIAGCALDGADGPQWMEAWIREMPNVLILPRSADYSEEVWMEIREKSISILQSYFLDGVVPDNTVSEGERSETGFEDDLSDKRVKESPMQVCDVEADENRLCPEYYKKQANCQENESHVQSQLSAMSHISSSRTEGTRSRSSKKAKKRPARRRSKKKSDNEEESISNYTSHKDDDTAVSGRDLGLSSVSRFASPDDTKNRQTSVSEPSLESTSEKQASENTGLLGKSIELLKDGFVIALRARDRPGFLVSRQRVPGGGWFLDTISNVTKRDPAAQFLVNFQNKDIIGLRSFAAGGKLLQINRRVEFVFASYSFDVSESWSLEGSKLEQCRLINRRNPMAILDVRIEILAVVGEDDGIARWLD